MDTKPQSFYRYFPVSRRDQNWGLHVCSVGESRVPAHTPYPPGGHPKGYQFDWARGRVLNDYALVYISRGRGWFECRGSRRRRIESGDVFLLFPGLWHRYRPDPESGWDEHWIVFGGSQAQQLVRNGFFSPREPVLRTDQEGRLLELFTHLINDIRQHRSALQQLMAGNTVHILSLLYSARQTSVGDDPRILAAVRETIRLMNRRLESPIDLTQLARELHVGYTWLRRSFSRHTGLSPHQYLLQLRIARARNLLTESQLTAKEIAVRAGFEDAYYFSRIFKKKTGLSPGQWRKQSQRRA